MNWQITDRAPAECGAVFMLGGGRDRQALCLPPPQTPGQPQSALCVQEPWLPSVGTSLPQTHLRPHCWLATSTTSHPTPPSASTYFQFSLSSFPRGWRWPQSYRPDEQTSATAREERAGLEDLTSMRVAVTVWSPGPTCRWGSQQARCRSIMSNFSTPWTVATRILYPWDSPSNNTGVGCHALFQGIIPAQESNPGVLHCRQTLYHLSHPGSLLRTKWTQNKAKPRKKWVLISGLGYWDLVRLLRSSRGDMY